MPRRSAGFALLLLLILLTYANSFGNGFHFDDFHTVVDNPAIRSLSNAPRFFTDATTFSVLPANRTYRPMVSLSLALDYQLGRGYSPWAFHLGTLLCFAGLCASLVLLFEAILQAISPASSANSYVSLFAAAWFAVHPAAAETVNYIIQRGDLYCTLGCVLALLLYARFPAARRLGLYLAPFIVAMLSKPPAAVFPALLFVYVLLFDAPGLRENREGFPARQRWKRAAAAALPALLLDGLLLSLQAVMTPKSFTPSILSPAAYRMTQLWVLLRYVATLFLPIHLNVDTDLQPIEHWDIEATAGLLGLAALLALAVWAMRRPRWYPVAFGCLWFFLTQLPTSLYPLSEVENDHRLFFSLPGLILATVWAGYLGLCHVQDRFRPPQRWRRAALALGLLLLCSYAAGAHRRNAVWHDEASLWRDDVEKSPRNGRGLMIYGLTRLNQGDSAEALQLFERALQLTPNYPTLEINLGVVNGVLADQGDPARVSEAERHFRRAIALAPADDTTHAFYGRWLLEHGLNSEAAAELREAVRLNPVRAMQAELLASALRPVPGEQTSQTTLPGVTNTPRSPSAAFWLNASLAEYGKAQWAESMRFARRALLLDPGSAEAYNNLAAAYAAQGKWAEAARQARQAVALKPGLAIAQNNLRWITSQQQMTPAARNATADSLVQLSLRLYQERHFAEGLRAAQRATGVNPDSAEAWNNIAANAEELGQWDVAVAAATKAVALRPGFELARNNLQWSLQKRAQQAKANGQ